MNVPIARAAVFFCALCLAGPALAQDATAAMQSELGTQVLEGCDSELTQHCAEDARRGPAARLPLRVWRQAVGPVRVRAV
jgi:hypothetical protein